MYKIELQWKEFGVDLEAIVAKFTTDYPTNYKATQAHSVLEIWFEEEPNQTDKDNIQAYWDALTSGSADALSYRSSAAIKNAIATAKAGLPAKTWDSMSTIERKIVIGQVVSKQELITAVLL